MNRERLLKVIISPHLSEKSNIATEKDNRYAFRVVKTATKPEIKDAIEFVFNAKVKSVSIVNVKAKGKIFRGVKGKKKAWKKAYVTLNADQKLNFLET